MSIGNGYLLDTNVISRLCRPQAPGYLQLEAKMKAIGEAPVLLPVIAIAEIEFGMAKAVAVVDDARLRPRHSAVITGREQEEAVRTIAISNPAVPEPSLRLPN